MDPLASGLVVDHAWIDVVDEDGATTRAGAADTPFVGLERFRVYRVRFRIVNGQAESMELVPVLQVRQGAQPGAFRAVPERDPVVGVPFYVTGDDGRAIRPRIEPVAVGSLRATSPGAQAVAVPGARHAGLNPGRPIRLPAGGYTEIEFAVRATIDAAWLTTYTFRLADGKDPVDGRLATVTLGEKPPVILSPGQRNGIAVDEPLPRYPLRAPVTSPASAVGSAFLAPLAAPRPSALSGPLAPAAPFDSPHTNYSLTTDACAGCHGAHAAKSQMLLAEPAPQATLCFTCHDGTGSVIDVAAEYSDPGVPANDPATASWYSHPATDPSDHVSDREEEFGGLLDRHTACADCHQPHRADGSLPTQTAAGWTASGAIAGASGVVVTNGAAGTSPTYAWSPTSELEYQVCFKCHSGYTQLRARDPSHPSRWALDKAVELNPANLSYHPVEAAGKNQTTAMANSLAGTSPYKLWNFDTTSTVRCLNCHGDADEVTPGLPPGADARLSNHAGPNRGLLMANYRDRTLKGSFELYDAADFALCYLCHAEAPFVDQSGDPRTDTGFRLHGLHLRDITGIGSGSLDIDVDGGGRGNALCAECHFRVHGTTYAVDGQAAGPGLVNFAPNARPYGGAGALQWTRTGVGTGSCTLTCHGRQHDDFQY